MSKTATLSAFEHHYLKLLVTPRSPAEGAGQPIDRATLHVLLQRSMQDSFGTVGAGAIAASPEGIETVSVGAAAPDYAEDASARDVVLRVASSAITPFLAMLPLSTASLEYSFEILGHSPSLPLVKAARSREARAGTKAWLDSFEEVV